MNVADANLLVGVYHLTVVNNFQVLVYFAVAFVGIHNHVKVLVGAEHFSQYASERLFEHAYHCGLVNVLQFLELRKAVDHIDCFFFLCHNLLKFN